MIDMDKLFEEDFSAYRDIRGAEIVSEIMENYWREDRERCQRMIEFCREELI